jgi:outer membrane protein
MHALVAAAVIVAAAQPVPVEREPALLTLERAIAIARDRNPDLKRQDLVAQQAEADLVAARSAILPHLDFNASAGAFRVGQGNTFNGTVYSALDAPVSGGTFGLGASLRQLVFDGGKWWNNLSAASSGVEAGQQQVAEQRLEVTFLVTQRFLELVRARQFLRVMQGAAARSAEQAGITERLTQSGRATQADALAARANRTNDAIAQRRQAAVAEQTRLELAAAIGLEPQEPLEIEDPPDFTRPPQPPPALDRAVAEALQRRPVLRAAQAQVEAQRKSAAALVGDYWPTLSLGASYTRDARNIDQLFGSIDDLSVAFAGATLTWNIFNGLGNKAQVDRARLQAQIAAHDLATARRNVAIEVEKAISGVVAAVDSAKLADESQRAAQEGLKEARARQQGGSGSQFEARDAELRLTQSQLSLVAALADARIAEAAVVRAVGGGSAASR